MSSSEEKILKTPSLKKRKILLANWGCADPDSLQCRDLIPLFKKMFGKLIILPLRNYYYFYGKRELNIKFLRIIKREKPDYLIFCDRYNEIEIDTIKKIKEISPNTKTILEQGDDDLRFDDWGRYLALFFDYVMTTKKETEIYKKENINDVFFLLGTDPNFYRPLNLEKKYDVTFIGKPIADRYDYIKFLKEHGVNIRLFGGEWSKHPDLKDIWGGVLFGEDFIKVINQSKINLNFSKTFYEKGKQGQLKGRILEVPACGSFLLNEYTDKNLEFINNRKQINFRNRKELLEKIDYYLKHEKERETIAKEMHEYVIKHHSWEFIFSNFFKKIDRDKLKQFKLPEINKKIIKISYNEMNKSLNEVKKKFNNADYVQAYSLFISKKQISCCDYYIHSRLLGDYLAFKSKHAFNTLGNKFYQFLNINQLMMTKEYFFKNFDFFKKIYSGEINTQQGRIKEEDIVFISLPLIRIKNLPKTKYKDIKENFYMLFFDKIFSLIYRKKFFNPYIFKFFLFSLMGNLFMIRYLFYKFSFNFNRNILRSFGWMN
jgi:hypothetical protein